ncbi:MAG TPA: DUF6015 family protein [Thermoplasmata archaeon]|nr:DUF6015 family protein [Thermoplasmata archaeon]
MAQIKEDELVRAIDRTLVKHGKLPEGESPRVARLVLGYFGLHDSVLDNKLSSDDRDQFYRLEEEGLLSSEEEDATVSRGKTWRIHYWLLKKDRIREVGERREEAAPSGAEQVYKDISDSEWRRPGPSGGSSGPRR